MAGQGRSRQTAFREVDATRPDWKALRPYPSSPELHLETSRSQFPYPCPTMSSSECWVQQSYLQNVYTPPPSPPRDTQYPSVVPSAGYPPKKLSNIPYPPNNMFTKKYPQPPASPPQTQVIVPDWDEYELQAVIASKAKYTLKSSKYPRTLRDPIRIHLAISPTLIYSLHHILLRTFSPVLSSLLTASASTSTPTSPLRLTLSPPLSTCSPAAWHIFTSWLYTLDKDPLPDFTPRISSSWSTSDLLSAALLSSHLKAKKFECWLLRAIMPFCHHPDYPESYYPHPSSTSPRRRSGPVFTTSDLRTLTLTLGRHTGLYWFSTAYLRWQASNYLYTLDPFRWRIEHWYGLCGKEANWGCNHAMNTSGWGGVWERQRGLRERGVDGWMWEGRGRVHKVGEVSGREGDEGTLDMTKLTCRARGRGNTGVMGVSDGEDKEWDEGEFIEDWCSEEQGLGLGLGECGLDMGAVDFGDLQDGAEWGID